MILNNRTNFSDIIKSDCNEMKQFHNMTIPISHSSAFIDIDGDCINDLLIVSENSVANDTSRYLEIWKGYNINGQIKYCLLPQRLHKIHPLLGHFSLGDINRDGFIDIVFAIKNTSSIFVAYNKFISIYNWWSDYCGTHNTSDNNDNAAIFDNLDSISEHNNVILIINYFRTVAK